MKTIFYISIDPIIYRRRVLNQIESARELGWNAIAITVAPKLQDNSDFPIFYIKQPFKRGPFRFLYFNYHVLKILIKTRFDIIHARGLWVLPSILVIGVFRKFKLVYDAHEFFAGHELFQKHLWRRLTWLKLEKAAVSKMDVLITVSEPLGEFYKKLYPGLKRIEIIRSLPKLKKTASTKERINKKSELVFHGYFLPGRGLSQLVRAVAQLKNIDFTLTLIGQGILEEQLRSLIQKYDLTEKVKIEPMVQSHKLLETIQSMDLGISLIEADSINRKYALPNKFFEYIHAGLPVFASNIPTLKEYVEKYGVGITTDPDSVDGIAEKLQSLLSDKNLLLNYKENCRSAAKELCWENESRKLLQVYKNL